MRQELKAGEWNPICVPFKLYYRELDDIFGTGTKIEELRDVSYDKDSQTLTFTFGFATEIEPGATCLINPTSDIQFADYGNRNISDGLHPALYYGIDLGNGMRADFLQKGSFTKEKLSSTEKENVLYWKENGLRQAPSQTEYIVLGFSNCEHSKPNLKVLHPLPRITEISQDVDDNPKAYFFQQAKNGLYARQAIICRALGIE